MAKLNGGAIMKFNLLSIAAACCILLLASCNEKLMAVDKNGKTVVERYGQLQVKNGQLCNSKGKPVVLRGISSYGLHMAGKYANEDVIKWLRDDWNMMIWRAAMYTTEGGYISRPAIKSKVVDSVDAAIKLGIYVIIDWHILRDGDPRAYQDRAVEFFTEMAQKYGEYPNVIYEICNEPNGNVTWGESVKPYAEAVISVIRQYDPDNIIIVGTPTWSQDVDIASEDPLQDDNIMYTLHFYAGTHGANLRSKAEIALKNGIALFVTEFGTTQASGSGGVFEAETLEWFSFLQKNNISWVNWSLTNNGEDSGLLIYNADRDGKGGWNELTLSQSGKFIRGVLRNEIEIK
jgi:endoglucanase